MKTGGGLVAQRLNNDERATTGLVSVQIHGLVLSFKCPFGLMCDLY